MKKVIVSLLFAFVLFLGTAPSVAVATENDIIATLEATSLPANYVQQAKNHLMSFVLFLGKAPNVAVATENDIIATLEATSLPANYVQQAKNYLMSNEVSATEADQTIAYINNAQAIVTASGAKSMNQLSTAEKQAILAELSAAAAILDMTVTVTSKKVIFSSADGTIATFPTKGNAVK